MRTEYEGEYTRKRYPYQPKTPGEHIKDHKVVTDETQRKLIDKLDNFLPWDALIEESLPISLQFTNGYSGGRIFFDRRTPENNRTMTISSINGNYIKFDIDPQVKEVVPETEIDTTFQAKDTNQHIETTWIDGILAQIQKAKKEKSVQWVVQQDRFGESKRIDII